MSDERRPPPTEEKFEKLLKLSEQLNRVLGEAVSLMVAMPRYQEWRIADLKARILPPIALRQCKIFRQKGFPVAFVSWALLSEEIEKKTLRDQSRTAARAPRMAFWLVPPHYRCGFAQGQ
jgi:cytolysin-activating lysine-acyltransferase